MLRGWHAQRINRNNNNTEVVDRRPENWSQRVEKSSEEHEWCCQRRWYRHIAHRLKYVKGLHNALRHMLAWWLVTWFHNDTEALTKIWPLTTSRPVVVSCGAVKHHHWTTEDRGTLLWFRHGGSERQVLQCATSTVKLDPGSVTCTEWTKTAASAFCSAAQCPLGRT